MGTGIKRQTSWPLLIYGLRTATEAAARAAYDWIGRGEKHRGDVVAAEAMRVQLSKLPIDGVVVVGEGDKGISPGSTTVSSSATRATGRSSTSPSIRSRERAMLPRA